MSESFWKGIFSPFQKAADCDHGSIAIWFEEPEFGAVRANVQFDHYCSNGMPAPSNSTVYTFEIELDNFGSAMYDDVADLESEISQMTDSEKLKWLNENLVHTE